MPSLTLLDASGDTTIVWDEDTEDKMLEIIQKKMDEGIVFYIVKPSRIPLIPSRNVRAKKVADIKKAGAVVIKDADLDALFRDGVISTVKAPEGDLQTVGRAKTAREVSKNHTVAVRPQRGG